MRYVDGVVGNSSSGIIEAPSFKIGTVNIGNRQHGRQRADSVIDCGPGRAEISNALRTLYSPDFRTRLECTVNPYGESGAASRILPILLTTPLEGLTTKRFFDIPIPDSIVGKSRENA